MHSQWLYFPGPSNSHKMWVPAFPGAPIRPRLESHATKYTLLLSVYVYAEIVKGHTLYSIMYTANNMKTAIYTCKKHIVMVRLTYCKYLRALERAFRFNFACLWVPER